MDNIKAIFFDLSGVIYEGKRLIPGASDVIYRLRKTHFQLRFVTNTATKNTETILSELCEMGIQVHANELFTAPMAVKQYLLQEQLRPKLVVHPNIISEFSDLNCDNPNCVVMGDARDQLHYQSLNEIFQMCHAGMPLIGIGMNKYFKDENGLQLDAGPFIRAIEWAAGVDAIIMGKPNLIFFQAVVESTGLAESQCLMIGDDVISDVNGAVEAGLFGVLVKTGKYLIGDEKKLLKGGIVFDDLAEWENNIFRS